MVSIIKKAIIDPIKKIKGASSISLYIMITDGGYFPTFSDNETKSTAKYSVYADCQCIVQKTYSSKYCKKLINEANEILKIFNEKVKPRAFFNVNFTDVLDYEEKQFHEITSYKYRLNGLKHVTISDKISTTRHGTYNHPISFKSFNGDIKIVAMHYDDNLEFSEDYFAFYAYGVENIRERVIKELIKRNRADIALELMI